MSIKQQSQSNITFTILLAEDEVLEIETAKELNKVLKESLKN